MFFGREKELATLNSKYVLKKSELVVLYGRRRVGKTLLIQHFLHDKPHTFTFEGIEGENSRKQMEHFKTAMNSVTQDPLLEDITFSNWDKVFLYLTESIIKKKRGSKKIVLFFDEIQWMAAGRKRLISILKYFWDNYWKDQNVMLILCGSVASFMVEKVINSTALYGRITEEMLLKGLHPNEIPLFFKGKRDIREIMNYQLVFGGVPKYFEEINIKDSFNKNINRLCFSSNSLMLHEVDRIFYKQYSHAEIYLAIVHLLKNESLSFQQITKKLNRKSGGSLKKILMQLEYAELIESYVSFEKGWNSKFRKYRLSDEFLRFYFKYMEPYVDIIKRAGNAPRLFEKLSKDSVDIWFGFAFERFCLKHAWYLAEKMGFGEETLFASPFFGKNDSKFQIDLLYKRVDNVIVVCEIKYHSGEISASVIKEVERKLKLLTPPRGYSVEKALISLYGPDKTLEESGYFDYHLTLEDILK